MEIEDISQFLELRQLNRDEITDKSYIIPIVNCKFTNRASKDWVYFTITDIVRFIFEPFAYHQLSNKNFEFKVKESEDFSLWSQQIHHCQMFARPHESEVKLLDKPSSLLQKESTSVGSNEAPDNQSELGANLAPFLCSHHQINNVRTD